MDIFVYDDIWEYKLDIPNAQDVKVIMLYSYDPKQYFFDSTVYDLLMAGF